MYVRIFDNDSSNYTDTHLPSTTGWTETHMHTILSWTQLCLTSSYHDCFTVSKCDLHTYIRTYTCIMQMKNTALYSYLATVWATAITSTSSDLSKLSRSGFFARSSGGLNTMGTPGIEVDSEKMMWSPIIEFSSSWVVWRLVRDRRKVLLDPALASLLLGRISPSWSTGKRMSL